MRNSLLLCVVWILAWTLGCSKNPSQTEPPADEVQQGSERNTTADGGKEGTPERAEPAQGDLAPDTPSPDLTTQDAAPDTPDSAQEAAASDEPSGDTGAEIAPEQRMEMLPPEPSSQEEREPENVPEAGPESIPESIPEPTPEAECSGQETRPCYDGAAGTRGKGACTDGSQTCQSGKWGACTGSVGPTTEVCNGKDDDCDGQMDEDYPGVGQACELGKGICAAQGKWVCSSDGSKVECNATPGAAQSETCNGKDDDCNGAIDEGSSCTAAKALWAVAAGDTGYDAGLSMASGPQDTIHVGGISQSSSISFGTLTPQKRGYAFGTQLSSAGTFSWAQTMGAWNGAAIATDPQGNVYVTGYFNQRFVHGTTSIRSNGKGDIYVAKFDKTGAFQWVATAGGSGDDSGIAIAADATGSAYVTGYFAGNATFGSLTATGQGTNWEIFVAKLNPNGTFAWVSSGGTPGSEFANAIAVDSKGRTTITGRILGDVTFGTFKRNVASSSAYLAQLGSSGKFTKFSVLSGTGPAEGRGLVYDAQDNLYIAGTFGGALTFTRTTLTSGGSIEAFLAKATHDGQFLWAKATLGNSQSRMRVSNVVLDPTGGVVFGGTMNGSVKLDSQTLQNPSRSGPYVARVDYSGQTHWTYIAPQTTVVDLGGLAVDSKGDVYITGSFDTSAKFGTTTLTSKGSRDLYIHKIGR